MSDQDLEKVEDLEGNINQETNDVQSMQPEIKRKRFSQTWFGKLVYTIVILGLIFFAVFILPPYLQRIVISISKVNIGASSGNEAELAENKAILESSISKLNKQIDAFTPDSYYMIINSTDNEFTLMKGKEVSRQGKCSTGSYVVLEDNKQRKYLFKTPKGLRKVLGKKTDPVWTKPNWAFIEEGLPVPSANHPSRFEEGVLGDYAINLGNGYMIHGTIWQRYLGLPVTHGCVRLNDADLEAVYKALSKGSNVYIY